MIDARQCTSQVMQHVETFLGEPETRLKAMLIKKVALLFYTHQAGMQETAHLQTVRAKLEEMCLDIELTKAEEFSQFLKSLRTGRKTKYSIFLDHFLKLMDITKNANSRHGLRLKKYVLLHIGDIFVCDTSSQSRIYAIFDVLLNTLLSYSGAEDPHVDSIRHTVLDFINILCHHNERYSSKIASRFRDFLLSIKTYNEKDTSTARGIQLYTASIVVRTLSYLPRSLPETDISPLIEMLKHSGRVSFKEQYTVYMLAKSLFALSSTCFFIKEMVITNLPTIFEAMKLQEVKDPNSFHTILYNLSDFLSQSFSEHEMALERHLPEIIEIMHRIGQGTSIDQMKARTNIAIILNKLMARNGHLAIEVGKHIEVVVDMLDTRCSEQELNEKEMQKHVLNMFDWLYDRDISSRSTIVEAIPKILEVLLTARSDTTVNWSIRYSSFILLGNIFMDSPETRPLILESLTGLLEMLDQSSDRKTPTLQKTRYATIRFLHKVYKETASTEIHRQISMRLPSLISFLYDTGTDETIYLTNLRKHTVATLQWIYDDFTETHLIYRNNLEAFFSVVKNIDEDNDEYIISMTILLRILTEIEGGDLTILEEIQGYGQQLEKMQRMVSRGNCMAATRARSHVRLLLRQY